MHFIYILATKTNVGIFLGRRVLQWKFFGAKMSCGKTLNTFSGEARIYWRGGIGQLFRFLWDHHIMHYSLRRNYGNKMVSHPWIVSEPFGRKRASFKFFAESRSQTWMGNYSPIRRASASINWQHHHGPWWFTAIRISGRFPLELFCFQVVEMVAGLGAW